MTPEDRLNEPWLVAVWPGMGQVAMTAGYYLMAKLGMHLLDEFSARDLFDVGHVEVKDGVLQTGSLPRSRLFVWEDPKKQRDLVLFTGEAQPPLGKYKFCRKLIDCARDLGVKRVFTFAAMGTAMVPENNSRVYGAATDRESVAELRRLELKILEDGNIAGLNGLLLGVAAECGLRGSCLLGEIPYMFAQVPFPKAALAVLEAFTTLMRIDIDLTELSEQAVAMEQALVGVMEKIRGTVQELGEQTEEETYMQEASEEKGRTPEDEKRIEDLFEEAARDRAKAYKLKRELDRQGAFREYEDRFLDLFKKSPDGLGDSPEE